MEIPEFSFKGKEISSFSIRPSFTAVSLSFNIQSGFDTYIRQEKFRIKGSDTKEYGSDDPGRIYSGRIGTGLSSVFVGERAYRNNIVKNYIDGKYLDVIESYNKYANKLKETPFAKETALLYALSLTHTGSISQGAEILENLTKTEGSFSDIAEDALYGYFNETKNYDKIRQLSQKDNNFTPYSLYVYLNTLLQERNYDKIMQVLSSRKEMVKANPALYDFEIISEYFTGDYDGVIALSEHQSPNTSHLLADAYLNEGMPEKAYAIMKNLPAEKSVSLMSAKYYLAQNEQILALNETRKLNSDSEKLNVLFYYVGNQFPAVDLSFIMSIKFEQPANRDYQNFYTGLALLKRGHSKKAAMYLDRVGFNTELVRTAYFYRGLAYAQFDTGRAEYLLLKYIENSNDEQRINIARFMLGQMKYIAGEYPEALMVTEECTEDFCSVLKAKVHTARNRFGYSNGLLEDVSGDDAAYVRATNYYNLKNYKESAKQIENMQAPGKDAVYLLMLNYFKLKQFEYAQDLFQQYSNDAGFAKALLQNLFLAGEYERILVYLQEINSNDPFFKLMRAKALFSLREYQKAMPIYTELIEQKYELYDSIYGLLSIYAVRNMQEEFIQIGSALVSSEEEFDRKDYLMIQTARLALEKGRFKLATRLLNKFFDEYKASTYRVDALMLRGRVFKETGRIDLCIQDAQSLIEKGSQAAEAMYLKAQCLETKSAAQAVQTYAELAEKSERYAPLSHDKIIMLSGDAEKVLSSAQFFKDSDEARYFKGIEKYFGMLPNMTLVKKEDMLKKLIASRKESILPAAYFYMGKVMQIKKEYGSAARFYMKGYYLFPESGFAKPSLQMSIAAYKRLGRTKEVQVLQKKLKNL